MQAGGELRHHRRQMKRGPVLAGCGKECPLGRGILDERRTMQSGMAEL